MTILEETPQGRAGHAGKRWYRFGHADEAVRRTEAWEHENFAEEQARWERSEPEYAQICDQVRRARKMGGEASLRADEAKAEWDARVATQRQVNDDAQRAHHDVRADPMAIRRSATSPSASQRRKSRSPTSTRTPRLLIGAREGHHHMHTTFAIESNDSPAPGILPEPVRVHDEPTATTAPGGAR
jgi:hypothetical protein